MLTRLALLIVTLLGSSWLYAATVLPLGLERLQEDAEQIFLGTCVSNESRFDDASQMIVTFTTFRVDAPVKGTRDASYTIKQVGGATADGALVVPGVPKFEPGKEYLVFLPPASHLGFSSPIGLEQGSFAVYHRDGETYASNGRQLSQLLEKVPAHAIPTEVRAKLATVPGLTRKSRDLKVSDLVRLIKELQR